MKRSLFAVACLGTVTAAIVRGNYLLGFEVAIVFGLLAAATLFLVYRAFSTLSKLQLARQFIVLSFAACVFAILIFPASFNPDLGILIGDHQSERVARAQLHDVFLSDSEFANLSFECNFTKCIVIHVRGNIATSAALLDLRHRLFQNCPGASSRWLFWDVAVKDSGVTYHGCDLTIFGGGGEKRISPITRKHKVSGTTASAPTDLK
jgi:hypothetical protein